MNIMNLRIKNIMAIKHIDRMSEYMNMNMNMNSMRG